jgi:hypothetical protein
MDEQLQQQAKEDSQKNELDEFLRRAGIEEKGIDNFFLEIVRADDTLKIGNLTETELGKPILPVRTLLELANDCKDIPCMSSLETDFRLTAEDMAKTSLSKDGFLIKMRVTQVKKFMDKAKKRIKGGLFGKKEVEVEE